MAERQANGKLLCHGDPAFGPFVLPGSQAYHHLHAALRSEHPENTMEAASCVLGYDGHHRFWQSVLAIICDDEPGTKLYPLTKRRSKSALPVSAHYRIIDFVVSNCINSDITKMYALTQFNSTSLNSHISRAYSDVKLGKDGFVEVLTTYQSAEDLSWFKGNADAVRRWLWLLEEHQVKDFLVLPGHHLYEMDYRELIKAHRDNRADITIAMAKNDRNYDASHDFLLHTSKNQFHGLMLAPDSVHSPSGAVSCHPSSESRECSLIYE
ncbi:hypothetical protein BHM03_00020645 [Ensete ventricosum]|nr:hypothetical protein BHM03_00020645 [Ensete ventricosum]